MPSRLEDILVKTRLGQSSAYGGTSGADNSRRVSEMASAIESGFREIASKFAAYDDIIRALAEKHGVTVDDVIPPPSAECAEDKIKIAVNEQRRKAVREILGG